ncbi:hypothetical protein ABZ820_14785 [Streptomyces diacarni]|uniref:hypothetical protein n=1 Tax=Streptomyces diacarni TaxID=2800381 RepID=UPI0033E759C3
MSWQPDISKVPTHEHGQRPTWPPATASTVAVLGRGRRGPLGHQRRLLHEDTLELERRLAGLLLLLYAQWPAAVSRLALDHIGDADGAVRIRLGSAPDELPAPVADLARTLGIDTTVTAKWQRAAAGDWAADAAEVSRRPRAS